MRILFDGNTLQNGKAGIGHYTYNLILNITKILNDNETLTVGIRQKLLDKAGDLGLDGIEIRPTHERSFSKYAPFCPNWLKGFDLYHQPNYIPHVFGGKTVVTVHDMSHRVFPQYHPWRRVALLRAFEGRLRQADRIITVSEYSRQEIMGMLKIPEEKIKFTYLGAGPQFQPLTLSEANELLLRYRYRLPARFLLYVGTIEPRKNLQRLLEAYYLYQREEPDSGLKLVLAGGKGWLYKNIFTRVKELGLAQEVIFAGYVNNEDLPYLYNMAEAFIYPSLYEGFGLPPLEAMSCGTPVISSNVASIPEVVGQAGLLVDPYQAGELAQAIYKLAGSVSLREEMSRLGLEQARKFSWRQCAAETLQVYRECITQ